MIKLTIIIASIHFVVLLITFTCSIFTMHGGSILGLPYGSWGRASLVLGAPFTFLNLNLPTGAYWLGILFNSLIWGLVLAFVYASISASLKRRHKTSSGS